MLNQYGLDWEDSLGGCEHQWSAEPSLEQIEQVSRQHLHLNELAICTVKFYVQGRFNKLYTCGYEYWKMVDASSSTRGPIQNGGTLYRAGIMLVSP